VLGCRLTRLLSGSFPALPLPVRGHGKKRTAGGEEKRGVLSSHLWPLIMIDLRAT